MSPTAAISLAIGIIALGALTAIGIIAALDAASRRLEHLITEALDHDPLDDIPADWTDDLDDEYRTLLEENA